MPLNERANQVGKETTRGRTAPRTNAYNAGPHVKFAAEMERSF